MNENKKAKIVILPSKKESSGNIRYVIMENIDFENNGKINISDTSMKNTGYVNEREGTTNIEGVVETDSLIVNKGIFNIKKTGKLSIRLQNIHRDNPFLFWVTVFASFMGIITGIIYLVDLIF